MPQSPTPRTLWTMAQGNPGNVRIELVWPGKRLARMPTDTELAVRERNGDAADGAWTNKLVLGDNVRAVAALTSGEWADEIARAGGVKLVYIDPPFGVGADFALDRSAWTGAPGIAYRDTWDESEGGSSHLQWLFERISAARALLAQDGVLYLHVDWRAAAQARLLLDEVFGADRFRGWIVWRSGSGAKSRSRWSQEHHDILCYSKGPSMTFRADAAAMREPFAATSRRMHFKLQDESGRRYRSRVVNGKEYRYFEDEGRAIGSVWTDCPSMAANSPILSESVGWPTQKPEKLLERILEASSAPGDLVADLCSGSGTTAAVAERLGRRWIACDVSAIAVHTARKRLLGVQEKLASRAEARCAFDVLDVRGAARAESVSTSIVARIERAYSGSRVVLEGLTFAGPEVATVESALPPGASAPATDDGRVLSIARDRRGRIERGVIAEGWREFIDAWGIVLDPGSGAPRVEWAWKRARSDEELATASRRLPAGTRSVLVRVVDLCAGEVERRLTL